MSSLDYMDDVFRALFSAGLGADIEVSTTADRKHSLPSHTAGTLHGAFDHGFLVGPADPLATWPRVFVAYKDLFIGHASVTDGPLAPRVRDVLQRLHGPARALFLIRSTPLLTAGDRQ